MYGRWVVYVWVDRYVEGNSEGVVELSWVGGEVWDRYESKEVELRMKEEEVVG